VYKSPSLNLLATKQLFFNCLKVFFPIKLAAQLFTMHNQLNSALFFQESKEYG